MTEFLVELYVSRRDFAALEYAADRGRIETAVEELSRDGVQVRYLRRIFVPEDETCLLLFEAQSVEAVREVARRAAVPFEHIAEACADPLSEEVGQ